MAGDYTLKNGHFTNEPIVQTVIKECGNIDESLGAEEEKHEESQEEIIKSWGRKENSSVSSSIYRTGWINCCWCLIYNTEMERFCLKKKAMEKKKQTTLLGLFKLLEQKLSANPKAGLL